MVNLGPDLIWHRGDLLLAEDRRRVTEEASASHLLHLAWHLEHGRYWTAPENEEWVAASLDLLRLFAQGQGRRAVLAGTCAEYDWNRSDTNLWRESDPCRPATPYGRAKVELARKAAELARSMDVSLAWTRAFFIFGVGEDARRLVPSIIHGLLRNEKVALSSGRQVRDFMDTRDVGDALAALVDTDATMGPINVASGQGVSIRDIACLLAGLTGRDQTLLDFGALPDREGEPGFIVADTSQLKRACLLASTPPLSDRLFQCVNWHRARET
jgi:nucleoside-diphosphate-sugar epimerase